MTMSSMILMLRSIMITMRRITIMLTIWMFRMIVTIIPKSIKCFLPMHSFLNSKNISKPRIKWLRFLKGGVFSSSGSSAGMFKGLLTTSMMYTNTNYKYITIPNSINPHHKSPLTQEIVKFAAIKALPSTKIYVLMHIALSAGDPI